MKWNYCECGCHGSTVNLGSKEFWLYNDLKGKFVLIEGHGFLGNKIGEFTSTKAVGLALLPLAKQEQADLEKKLRDLKKLIEEISP